MRYKEIIETKLKIFNVCWSIKGDRLGDGEFTVTAFDKSQATRLAKAQLKDRYQRRDRTGLYSKQYAIVSVTDTGKEKDIKIDKAVTAIHQKIHHFR